MKRGVLRVIILLAFVAVAGVVVMVLWNSIVSPTVGWGTLSYLHSVGLFILCRLLFGGLGAKRAIAMQRGRKAELMEQVKGMSREERKEYIRGYYGRGDSENEQ